MLGPSMSKHSESIKFAAGVISVMAAGYFLKWIWMMLGDFGVVWSPWICQTDLLDRVSDPAGYRFETSQTICSGIGKGPADISVFASKLPRGKQALIFKYERMNDGSRDAEPVVALVDGGIVRISVKHVARIICRCEHWEALAIEYDIGREFTPAASLPGNCRDD
jgi:hypothetical protein